MRVTHLAIVTGLFLVGGAAAFTLVQRRHDASEMADLKKQVDDLSASGVRADREASSMPSYAPPAPVAPQPVIVQVAAAEPDGGAIAAPVAEARRHLEPTEIRDSLEIAFVADRTDHTLSAAEMHAAQQKIQAALPEGSQLRSFDCRASLCRVESIHADLSAYHQFLHGAFMDPSTQVWNAATYSVRMNDNDAPGDPVTIVSYLAREGQDLPALD